MPQTIRRKSCKTRREWADKKALKFWREHRGRLSDYGAKLLMMEHARAVRIVERAKALQLHGLRDTDTNEFLEGYAAACVDILSALMKGRA